MLGEDKLTLRAIEFDADLCAIGSLYRFSQPLTFSLGIPDVVVRKFVLSCIFFALRTLTAFCSRTTHSTVPDRLIQMQSKLAILNFMPGTDALPDVNCERPETRDMLGELAGCLIECEHVFQRLPEYSQSHGNLLDSLAQSAASRSWIEASTRWNEIRIRAAEQEGGRRLQFELAAGAVDAPPRR